MLLADRAYSPNLAPPRPHEGHGWVTLGMWWAAELVTTGQNRQPTRCLARQRPPVGNGRRIAVIVGERLADEWIGHRRTSLVSPMWIVVGVTIVE
jgi:hypothetical protein